jgi:hypothetical protein
MVIVLTCIYLFIFLFVEDEDWELCRFHIHARFLMIIHFDVQKFLRFSACDVLFFLCDLCLPPAYFVVFMLDMFSYFGEISS